jgi:hypothetical protein
MSTDTFRRHTRACVDVAIHRVFVSLRKSPSQACLFERLLRVAAVRAVVEVDALRNMLQFETMLERQPEDWPGLIGHPLRVIASLASHLFGRYPTPRFLASAWFGTNTLDRIARCQWFIAHARGKPFRSLALPIAMTRRMEHIFLRTPDHLVIDHALRRAEVLGLGGTPELADAVLTTRLAEDFADADRWRLALAWLAACGDSVDLAQVVPLVDYLHANLHAVELRGRTFVSVLRLVKDWHGWLGRQRMRFVSWPRSRWQGMVIPVEPTRHEPRRAEWTIGELLDSRELSHEGRAMRHCVASYAQDCAATRSTIWSLRHRWGDEGVTRSVLTIEVRPDSGVIVQVRAKANGRAGGWPLDLVRRWAAREGLRFHPSTAVAAVAVIPRGAAARLSPSARA